MLKPVNSLRVMADPRMMNAATLNAAISHGTAPGCLFNPSDQQLICYYLASKNSDIPRFATDLIKEVDLYVYEPFSLPETACFRYQKGGKRKHWFCYVRRQDVDARLRAAGRGFWKRKDGERNVTGEGVGRVVVGTRKTFVFYLWNDNSTAARKTQWRMYEYDLIRHHKASFVLCRVLMKPGPRKKISHRVSAPFCERCAETELRTGVIVARVPCSGLQDDGAATGDGNEDNANDGMDDIYNILFGQVSDLEDQDTSDPVAQQMEPFKEAAWAGTAADGVANEQLAEIFKDEILE